MRFYLTMTMILFVLFGGASAAHANRKDGATMENEAKVLIDEYTSKLIPLDVGLRSAWYKYATTGDKEESKREAELTLAIRKLNSDKKRFARIRDIYRERKKIGDPIIRREVEIVYLNHLPNQIPDDELKRLTDLQKKLDEGTNDYQPIVDGKKLSAADVEHTLTDSMDSMKLEKTWKAKHALAPLLEKDYRELVNLRNKIARDLGYKNAIELYAETGETDIKMLNKFYGDVAKATDEPFKKLKNEFIDPRLAKRYNVKVEELKPWHYQNAYFQEAPNAIFGKVDLDSLYSKTDANKLVGLVKEFWGSMGVDVGPIIARSSLFPKPGKNPHAFAEDLDPRKSDTSVLLMNLPVPPKPVKASDASTLVHELTHDINFEAVVANDELPYLLRSPTMLTEAVAELFPRQIRTIEWFRRMGVDENKASEAMESVNLVDYVDQIIFLRWASVIYCFENKFYNDPNLDIGDTWWECKTKYQFLKRPDGWKNPDALAKYHIPNVEPLYYANYAIGRVANVQFLDVIAKKIGVTSGDASYYGRKDLGDWLMKDFFAQGERYRWDDFIKISTGKPLSVAPWKKYYIDSGMGDKLFSN